MGPNPDHKDAIAALERLVSRHNVLSVEEARHAARIMTGDPEFEFPPKKEAPPAAAAEPQAPPAAAAKEEPAAEAAPAPAGENEKEGDGGNAS